MYAVPWRPAGPPPALWLHEDAFPHDHLTDEEKARLADAVWRLDNVEFTTVGIDVGSSTSHLMFSRVHLRRQAHQLSSRFVVIERRTLFSSPILLTPFLDDDTIDAAALATFVDEAYGHAGLARDEVDTGAVILTGEAVKRKNAAAIAALFAADAGKFVCASAGHHMECVLAAHGSGAAALSQSSGRVVLNCDIGGGTTKLGLCSGGVVVATCAFAVGGRLIAFDGAGRIVRLDEPAATAAAACNAALAVGAVPKPADITAIVDAMAAVVAGYVRRDPPAGLARDLLLTQPLTGPAAELLTFSGGVSEYLYGRETRTFGDIARPLAEAVRAACGTLGLEVVDPGAGIRATAIGVSQFTVQVSGRTIFLGTVTLPQRNLPVVAPHLHTNGAIHPDIVAKTIEIARERLDVERTAAHALALSFRGTPNYERLLALATGVAKSVRDSGREPLVLIIDGDVGQSLGRLLQHELHVERPLLCIDALELGEFDFVDIGKPVELAKGVPVVVKSLLFGR
ncbi:MAG: ethanolamine ammonia-lyase reactivating factor EutA [Candidatus Lustribacter sp.]